MWLPRILFSFMKPVHTFAFNVCFLLDIKLRCKPSKLMEHLLFSRFPFVLDQGFPHLLLFPHPFISSNFSCYQIVSWCQRAHLRNSCQRKGKKNDRPNDLVSLGNSPRGGYYCISFPKFPGVFIYYTLCAVLEQPFGGALGGRTHMTECRQSPTPISYL